MNRLLKVTPNSIHRIVGRKKNGDWIIVADFYQNNRLQSVLDKMAIAENYRHIESKIEALEHYLGIKDHSSKYPLIMLDDFNPHSSDGNINTGSIATWAGARGATTGTPGTGLSVYTWQISSSSWFVIRDFLNFNTAAIDDAATITGVTLKLYRDDSLDAFFNADTVTLHAVPQATASDTALTNNDFDNITFTSKGSIAYASTSNLAYNDLTINVDQISKTGYSKLALIDSCDLNNSAPSGRNTFTMQDSAAANPPILRVTYTLPGGAKMVNFT